MPHSIDVMVGKRVRLRRLQLSFSQTDLATKLGLTFQQVQKYEKGTNRISCSRLYEIAATLKVPITFFFSDENEVGTDMKVADNLDPAHIRDGLRLITAFGLIEKTKRKKVVAFAESLEKACVDTVDRDGIMTKDLALACGKTERSDYATTMEYLNAVERRMNGILKERL